MIVIAEISQGQVFALTGAALIGLGLYGFLILRHPLRQLLAMNVLGAGVFLLLGGMGRGPGASDPVAQALVITGIVVTVALTAFGAGLIMEVARERHEEREHGAAGEANGRSGSGSA